jgi:hypothetical protein
VAPRFEKIQAPNKRYQWVASAFPAFTVQLGRESDEWLIFDGRYHPTRCRTYAKRRAA